MNGLADTRSRWRLLPRSRWGCRLRRCSAAAAVMVSLGFVGLAGPRLCFADEATDTRAEETGATASAVSPQDGALPDIRDDESMLTAVREVSRMGGGFAATNGERLIASLPLPIAGATDCR